MSPAPPRCSASPPSASEWVAAAPYGPGWRVGCVTGVLVVAASRLYLGVHWLTDVTAGAILAAVFVTIGTTVFAALHDRSGQHDAPPVAASATGDDPPVRDVSAPAS